MDLPDEVKEKSRMCLIDNPGARLTGTLPRVSRICADYARAAWSLAQATILLHGKKFPLPVRLKDGREFTSGMKDGGMALTAAKWTRKEKADKFLWLKLKSVLFH